ncbi:MULTISPECIES: alanine dehydrogenase [Methanothermobacter]|uniref:Alanine dehydrogenase n=1 Tax=Methanothermobacter wolfeii TaxID=145261 RepID=A0A9E7UMX8_METWO|nr:alanine dehydrogenase [Methanothermobacter wolfeii]UXH31778.1 alanine dehydrogenase [Methanothermobacter wolfeii]
MEKTVILKKSHVEDLLSMDDCLKAVETAFIQDALGKVQMPPKNYLFFRRYGGDLRIMPSYLEEFEMAGVKCVNVHPSNPGRYSLPTVMAVIELVDPETGFPIALMDGTYITDMRTGAAGGVSVRYLARKDSGTLRIVGAGRQAWTQLMAIERVVDLEEVYVYCRTPENREKFAYKASKTFEVLVRAASSPEEAVRGMDIVVTVTPSREPVVKAEWVSPGTHICAMGADAPGKQELDPEILISARVFYDNWEQASHSGEINVPLKMGILGEDDLQGTISDVITGRIQGRTSDDDITVFDSTELSLQDVVSAWMVYERAVEEGRGVEIDLQG